MKLSSERVVVHHGGRGATQRIYILTYEDGTEERVTTRWSTTPARTRRRRRDKCQSYRTSS